MPVAQPPRRLAAYPVQVIPVVAVLQSMVSGTVQPELANAVAARIRPRAILYFMRDMNHSIR